MVAAVTASPPQSPCLVHPRWCPTTPPRKRPCSSGGPSSPTPKSRTSSPSTTSVRATRYSLHVLTPTQHQPRSTTPSSANHSRTRSDGPACRYPPQTPTATSTSGATSPSSSQSGPSPSPLRPAPLTPPSGLHLKENGTSPPSSIHPRSCPPATEIEGTFRVNGSAKRMRELQAAFETPPRVRIPLPSPSPIHPAP